MKRRVVRIVGFVASVVAIIMALSCSKEGVGEFEYAFSLGEIPESFGDGEAITVTIPIVTDAPLSEIVLDDVPTWINAYIKDSSVVLEIAENRTLEVRSHKIIVRLKDGSKSHGLDVFQDWFFVNGEGMVQFSDRAFKKAMLETWDSDHDGDISPDEALAIETVEAVGKGIHDISCIEAFRNVWKIDLRDNDIVDATAVKDHPFLHWLDLKGNPRLATFDVRGCTFYFDHCEFEVTDNLLYYCWRRQVNITPASDPNCEHSLHIKDVRETVDWSRQNRLVPVYLHTNGDGKKKICFSGVGYIDTDLEDGTFRRVMLEGIEAMLSRYPEIAARKDELDIYYMERIVSKRDQWMLNHADWETELYYSVKDDYYTEQTDIMRKTWEQTTGTEPGEDPEYFLLNINIDFTPMVNGPAFQSSSNWGDKVVNVYKNKWQFVQWHFMNIFLEEGDEGNVEAAYGSTFTPTYLISSFHSAFETFIEEVL